MLERCPGSYPLIGNGDGDSAGRAWCKPGYDFNDDNPAIGAAYWTSRLARRFPFERLWSGSVDTVGTGGESHTRFPIGISPGRLRPRWPRRGDRRHAARHAGVGAGALPGQMQPGVTLRDLVNAIPLYAIRQGLLTFENKR